MLADFTRFCAHSSMVGGTGCFPSLITLSYYTYDKMPAMVTKPVWENNLPVMDNLIGAGGKKKKKKQLGGGKKKKHVHKNVRMAVLKYFRIDGEGDEATVTRTRTECPECGAGVFLAKHFDRESCGKCGLSIRRK